MRNTVGHPFAHIPRDLADFDSVEPLFPAADGSALCQGGEATMVIPTTKPAMLVLCKAFFEHPLRDFSVSPGPEAELHKYENSPAWLLHETFHLLEAGCKWKQLWSSTSAPLNFIYRVLMFWSRSRHAVYEEGRPLQNTLPTVRTSGDQRIGGQQPQIRKCPSKVRRLLQIGRHRNTWEDFA